MNICKYLKSQLELHPSMQPQDVIKLCYQAAFGAEHLLQDKQRALNYFNEEFSYIEPHICNPNKKIADRLYEQISDNIYRINLDAWKTTGMPSKWLFEMFVNSMKPIDNGEYLFSKYLEILDKNFTNFQFNFSLCEWLDHKTKYLKDGIRAVHHSQIYRNKEKPAYRIVDARFIRLLPLLQKASQITSSNSAKVIAIDGRAASGKSTMADDLKLILKAGIIHMDDFFLPPALRTDERFKQPGGNVHYERFAEEILPHISSEFTYRRFDCHIMNYNENRFVEESEWRVVEGAYSLHPILRDYADLKVFSTIDSEEQMKRIVKRNGAEMAENFRTTWIPMEESYYEHYMIQNKCDLTI